MFADRSRKAAFCSSVGFHAIGDERIVDQRRVEFDNHLAFDELLLDLFCAFDLLRDAAKRLRYCAKGARLFDRAIKAEKTAGRDCAGDGRRFCGV